MRSVQYSRVIFISPLFSSFHHPRVACKSVKETTNPYQRFKSIISSFTMSISILKRLICSVIIQNIALFSQGYTLFSSNSFSFSSYSIKCSQSSLSISSNCASTSILKRLRNTFDCFFSSSIST